jgi:predicted amidophosphoribosyltransferase
VRDAFLDLVAGGSCLGCGRPGRRLCPWCDSGLRAEVGPVRPSPCPVGLVTVHAAGAYAGTLRELVLAHKERGALGLVSPLGRLLAEVVAGATPLHPERAVILVPVPSHPAVVRSRGHDPVLRLVRRSAGVLRRRGSRVAVRQALRVVGRPLDQSGLDAAGRAANLDGRFRGRQPAPTEGEVLLLDDVVTTGATLREAQRALEGAGWSVAGAATLAATRRRVAPR